MKKRDPQVSALEELEQIVRGRHASQQNVLARYQQCRDWREAAITLARALKAGHRHTRGSTLTPPAGWLPPTI